MSTEYTREDYWETVEAIAKEILTDCGLEENDWNERIHEEVDSNAYIIMYAGPPVVKEASDNWPTDLQEVQAMAGTVLDFVVLFATAAWMAMEQDVQEKCRELAEDAEVCDRCDSAVFGEVLKECEYCGDEICNECLIECHSGKLRCKDCYGEDEGEIPNQPDEQDAILSDCGPLGSWTSVVFDHKCLGEFKTEDEALDAIRARGNKYKYFPNVWRISDHGNPILLKDFDWTVK